jgi:hypothetical protein
LASNVENLVPNFWIYKNGTISTLLALSACCWHYWQVVSTFFFPDKTFLNKKVNIKYKIENSTNNKQQIYKEDLYKMTI